jgi:hypothetical protein
MLVLYLFSWTPIDVQLMPFAYERFSLLVPSLNLGQIRDVTSIVSKNVFQNPFLFKCWHSFFHIPLVMGE